MLSFTFNTFSINFLFNSTAFTGTFRDDYVFSFTGRGDVIDTGAGDDFISSGRGRDIITAGIGDDVVFAGNGSDEVDGGEGDDDIFGGRGRDTLNGGEGSDFIDGGRGADIINGGSGNDFLFGGRGSDTINGGEGDDEIDGGLGRDILNGGAGDDIINGGRGRDTIIYTASDDAGNDIVNGGQGRDTLVLELTAAQLADADVQADLAAYEAYVAGGSNGSYEFTTIGLTVTGGFEVLELVDLGGPVDPVDPVNTAPEVSGPVELADIIEDAGTIFIATSDLIANTTDADDDVIMVADVTSGPGGTISRSEVADGYDFRPNDDFNGTVTINYTVSDGASEPISTSATIDVIAENDAPEVQAVDLGTLAEDGSREFFRSVFTDAASDIDSVNLSLSDFRLVDPTQGTISLGDFGPSFTPALNFFGVVEFEFDISDGELTTTGIATLEVTPENDAPTANPTTITAIEDQEAPIEGTVDASDVDGDDLSYTFLGRTGEEGPVVVGRLIGDGLEGVFDLDEDTGAYTFVAENNSFGTASFLVGITDGTESVTTTVTIDVTGVNDSPVANTVDGGAVNEGETLTFSTQPFQNGGAPLPPLATDVDDFLDAASFTFDSVTIDGEAVADVSLAGFDYNREIGSITFDADADIFNSLAVGEQAVVEFGFTASDDEFSDTGTLSFTVNGTNDDLEISNQLSDRFLQVSPFRGDNTDTGNIFATDPDASDVLTYEVVDQPLSGTVTLDPNNPGNFTYEYEPMIVGIFDPENPNIDDEGPLVRPVFPDEELFGTDNFAILVSDGNGSQEEVNVFVNINDFVDELF